MAFPQFIDRCETEDSWKRAEIFYNPVSAYYTNHLADSAHRIIRGYQFLNDNQLPAQEALSHHIKRFIRGQAGLKTPGQSQE